MAKTGSEDTCLRLRDHGKLMAAHLHVVSFKRVACKKQSNWRKTRAALLKIIDDAKKERRKIDGQGQRSMCKVHTFECRLAVDLGTHHIGLQRAFPTHSSKEKLATLSVLLPCSRDRRPLANTSPEPKTVTNNEVVHRLIKKESNIWPAAFSNRRRRVRCTRGRYCCESGQLSTRRIT